MTVVVGPNGTTGPRGPGVVLGVGSAVVVAVVVSGGVVVVVVVVVGVVVVTSGCRGATLVRGTHV